MTRRYLKIALTVVVLVLAFAGLLWSTLREGAEYYIHVDEVMASPAQWEGKRLQVHGFVVPGSIKRKADSLDYIFKVENKGFVLDASVSGTVPDTFFSEGAEVVLKGRLTPTGFSTDRGGVMAKCPSKYEESKTLNDRAG
jgi:cytochrome c-type biogenesis protein CcmE